MEVWLEGSKCTEVSVWIMEGAASYEFVKVEACRYVQMGLWCLVRWERDTERASLRTAGDHAAHCQVSKNEKWNKFDWAEINFESYLCDWLAKGSLGRTGANENCIKF